MQLFHANGAITEIPVNAAEYEKVLTHHKNYSHLTSPYVGTNDCGYDYCLLLDSSMIGILFRGHRRMDKQNEAPLHVELTYKAGAKIVIMLTESEYTLILQCHPMAQDINGYYYSRDYFDNPYYIKLSPEVLSINATRETDE